MTTSSSSSASSLLTSDGLLGVASYAPAGLCPQASPNINPGPSCGRWRARMLGGGSGDPSRPPCLPVSGLPWLQVGVCAPPSPIPGLVYIGWLTCVTCTPSTTTTTSSSSSVITALTAQNSQEVRAVHVPPLSFLETTTSALMDDLPPAAIKTGMLPTSEVSRRYIT